jgi:hypothetical protein
MTFAEKARRSACLTFISVIGSKTMGYKASRPPQERLGLHGWAQVER